MEQLFANVSPGQIAVSLSIFGAFIGLAFLFRFFLRRAARRLAQKTEMKLGDAILSALQKPLVGIILAAGLYLSTSFLPLEATLRFYLSKGFNILLSLLGIYAVLALIDAIARWSDNTLAVKTEGGLTRRFLWLSRVAIWVVGIIAAIAVVLNVLSVEPTPIAGWIWEHGWRIAFIIVLSMASITAIARLTPKVIEKTIARRAGEPEEEVKKRTDTLARVLVNVGQIVALLITIFMVLSELQIDIAPILAGVGVAGIAIGFGAQSVVKDLLAGLFIIMENQYHVGDVVRIADIAGLVEDINLRRTVLRDLDGIVHFVPNGEIRVASNFTKEWSRVNLNITVAYGENLDHAISVINRVGEELAKDPRWAPLILKPPQVLRVDNLGASGIDIKILGDTKPIYQWDVMGELRKRLKDTFDKEHIEIPWPHTKVYFGNSPPSGV